MSVWELLIGYSSNNPTLFVFMSIANGLVITGKTINFVLFCLSSTHFRRKCAMIFFRKFPQVLILVYKLNNSNFFKLSQTEFGRRLSGRLSQSKPDFKGSMASLHRRNTGSIKHDGLQRNRLNDSKKFCTQLQPLTEASGTSVEESAENTQIPCDSC